MKTEVWHDTDCNGNELWVYPVLECDRRWSWRSCAGC